MSNRTPDGAVNWPYAAMAIAFFVCAAWLFGGPLIVIGGCS